MKSIFLIILGLFLCSESNNLVKHTCRSKNLEKNCTLCDQTPCECKDPASEDNNYKISLKKLIVLFLKKTNLKCSDSQANQECKLCRCNCATKHGIDKLLADILQKGCCTNEEEEESIREIIIDLLNNSKCHKQPCQIQCDPKVQAVLKTILKRATGCKCEDYPSNKIENRPRYGQKQYKYWFKASKDALRKEISSESKPQSDCCIQKIQCQEKKAQEERQNIDFPDVRKQNKSEKNKTVKKCTPKNSDKCKTCQRPCNLICLRSINDECPIKSKSDLFSLCADCNHCRIYPGNQNNYVALLSSECKPVNSPFVQFTRNGYPMKRESETNLRIQVKTKFLQINDFRSEETKSAEKVYNPFYPRSKFPRKKTRSGAASKKCKTISNFSSKIN